MKCPSPPGSVPAANAAAAGGTRLPPAQAGPGPGRRLRGRSSCGPGRAAARGRGAALCAPGRGAAGRGPGRLPLAAVGLRGAVGPLAAAPRGGSILCGDWPGGAGPEPRPRPRRGGPAEGAPLAPAAARGPRGVPPARPPAGAWWARPLCPPAASRAQRDGRADGRAGGQAAAWAAGSGAWPVRGGASREMRAGVARPAHAVLTARPDRVVGSGAPRHRRGEEARSPGGRNGFGLHVKNAAIWRLAVPGLAPKLFHLRKGKEQMRNGDGNTVEIGKATSLEAFLSTTDNTVLTVFHDSH
ncbi:nuclear transcription factor Y subunit beta isoform X2 [Elephas maximus indicus]|uniref:nuclear transcription factor Y subunit beta isoform X2 n=1 Tax=Elephas maximus indicus TaxID=99487 RepID=UPI0021172B61|nr:nuclear transcription factor Y subunit beta isoform X2 [Elephas maximus indicus]